MANIPDLKVGITFPGESLAIAILAYMQACRETASQANRDKFDELGILFIQDCRNLWQQK